MYRLYAATRIEARLQARNGFYAATLVMTALWAVALSQVNLHAQTRLWPPLLVGNLMINTLMFIGGLVLLERDERTLLAWTTTPLRFREYLAAKLFTLTALSLAETAVLVLFGYGTHIALLPLVCGIVLASVLYCLVGVIAVARYRAVNEYLLPAGAYAAVLWLPLIAYLAGWQHWLLWLHPMHAALMLVEASFTTVPTWQIIAACTSGMIWTALLITGSRWAFQRWLRVQQED